MSLPDVDLDVIDRETAATLFPQAVIASELARKMLTQHKSGLYFQRIPIDPVSDFSAFPYDVAEDLGYYKIDLLTAPYPYLSVRDETHLDQLLAAKVDWDWFLIPKFVETLFHFKGKVRHELSFAEVVADYAPTSLEDIACLIALKMPAKKYLIGESWEILRERMWSKEDNNLISFKLSHSIAYAHVAIIDAQLKAPVFFGKP